MRTRGLWISLVGVLVLLTICLEYENRARKEAALLRQSGWELFVEPNYFEEGAFLGAVVCVAGRLITLIRALGKSRQGRSQAVSVARIRK